MSYEPLRVPAHIANQPRPQRPESALWADWRHYYADLACWQAMRADVLRYGVVSDSRDSELARQSAVDALESASKQMEQPK